ncbi:hypothetical protein Quidividi_039 [Staphylococcus phage Quidividi]|nr:hypothetical protein Quidividi_039 [Staphylococcus phage Quidividi]
MKPLITLTQEETKLLLGYLELLKDDMRSYEGMPELYNHIQSKYKISKGIIVDKNEYL